MFKIMSPSYKRGSICSTHKYLPELYYVVSESEADQYEEMHDRVIAIPDSQQGSYAKVCNWILENADTDHIIIVDDDLKCFNRYNNQVLCRLSTDEAMEFIEHGCAMAEQLDVRYWGMNIVSDKGAYREYTPFALRAYLGGPFQAHYKNDLRYDEAMKLKEDYDMTLQVLNKYRRNLRFNMYSFTSDQHGMVGGCATYRTIEVEKAQNKALQKKWGSKIVREDSSTKQQYDINPIIKIPISGV